MNKMYQTCHDVPLVSAEEGAVVQMEKKKEKTMDNTEKIRGHKTHGRGNKGKSGKRHPQYRFDHFHILTSVNKDMCLFICTLSGFECRYSQV